ncbi:MAG: hypothetical protein Q8O59_02710 [bacterium]|nr:hypothetical protein [bacterium]
MKKRNKLLCVVAVIVIALAWWWLSSPRIEVKSLNMTPKQAGDYNLNLLPKEKQNRVYSSLVVVKASFRGKDYVAANPQDAVTVTGSGTETRACIYTNNPDVERLEKYIQ